MVRTVRTVPRVPRVPKGVCRVVAASLVGLALCVTGEGTEIGLSAQSATFKAPVPRFPDPDRRAKLATAFPEIDRLFQDYAAAAHVPGAAWGIIVDGQLAHTGVAGYRDVPSKAPQGYLTVSMLTVLPSG